MIEFKVGDTLSICAAVHEFCGTYSQVYSMGSIGISKYPDTCSITIDSHISLGTVCIPLSGLTVSFEFTNYNTTVIKSIANITTDSNGVASINYLLTQADADLFNNNPMFRVRAYLVGSGPNYPSATSSSRYQTAWDLLIRGNYIGNACVTKQSYSICLNDKTLIVYENPVYTDGTITDACVYRSGSSIVLPEGKIKVFRLTGSVWSVVGESGYLPIQNNGITTFTGLNIVALKGDYIGFYTKLSTYDACIDSSGGIGLVYAKTHAGDVVGSTDNSEWAILDNYRVAISATILPCVGVTCPNVCVGYNLYSQACDPVQGCIQGSLIEANSPTCGYVVPGVNRYELYYKIADIIPAWSVSSVLSIVYNGAVDAIRSFTGYYIESVDFDPSTYILTITMTSYATASSGIQSLVSPVSDSAIGALAVSIALVILFALGAITAPAAAIIFGAYLVVNYLIVTFLGKKETIGGQSPSTRVITLDAKICVGDATNPCSISNPLADNMVVLIEVVAGKEKQTGSITITTPIATFSVPTNVDISITAKVKDNPYYTVFTADPQSYPALKSCTPGSSCPTTIPITIKLFAQADAKVAPKVTDTAGNSLPGKYTLWIENNRGVKTEDGKGDLVNGQVPQGVIPANREYCVAIIPSDYPTHSMVFTCSTCLAGEICSPTLISQTCAESKNSLTIRCVYISTSGARLGFVPDEIDITDISTGTIRRILPGTPTPGSTCPGVINSDITCIDGLENNKTYKVHIVSSTYTVATATQDQQVTYTTDCGTGIMLTVEASPPPNTYDITIQVQNDTTLTALPGAIVTLGTMPLETTGSDGSVMFASVPQGTGIPLKVTLSGYKDYSNKVDVTTTRTITVQMSVDQILQTIDTRIANFKPSTIMYANSTVKFQGDLQYLDVTIYRPLTDAPIIITIKDKGGVVLQTLSATSRVGIGIIGAGYFETTDWLIPTGLADQDISVHAEFAGVGKYKPFSDNYTYHIGKECAVRNPITGECLISPLAGYGFIVLAGLGLLAAVMIFRPGGAAQTIVERVPYPVPKLATKE